MFKLINELQQINETPFENKVVSIDPNVHLKVTASDQQAARKFENLTIREKLHLLDRMYTAGQKLLLHIKSSKSGQVSFTDKSGNVQTETHFSDDEKGQMRSRVLQGFKKLKVITTAILAQLDAEEKAFQDAQNANGQQQGTLQ